MKKKPELLAPAGDMATLRSAIQAGCDAVYFGSESFNMRAKAKNFSLLELQEVANICKEAHVKTWLTINTIIFEGEEAELRNLIKSAKAAGINGIICWDLSVISIAKQEGMPFCISTQASIANSMSAEFYGSMGAQRVVLARECSLEKIKEIKQKSEFEIECFIHGAMCVAISGRCFLSQSAFNKSANRGECIQPCRRLYKIYDEQDNKSFLLGEDYLLSPKDLCTMPFIDRLIEAGIDSFKIEGRKRSPEYVFRVVSAYRKAIDLYFERKLTEETKRSLVETLKTVYNRGFSAGFYLGNPDDADFAKSYGSQATTRKVFAGEVINYFAKSSVAHIRIKASALKKGDQICIIGNTTGTMEMRLNEFMMDDRPAEEALKGTEITFVTEKRVRIKDQVFRILDLSGEME